MNGKYLQHVIRPVAFALGVGLLCSCARLAPGRKPEQLPVRGLHLMAPAKKDLPDALSLIRNVLPREGVNTLIIEFDFNYDFKSRREFSSPGRLDSNDVARIAAACREAGVELIPQINCLGHQSWAKHTGELLAKHPEFDETPGKYPGNKDIYCRSYCPLHPDVHAVLFDLIDELAAACRAKSFHVGMDEVFILADPDCPRCRGKDPAGLFADEVKRLHDHLKSIGCRMWMWGDRLIDGKATGIGSWEASCNGTARAVDEIPRDIVICDWHYEKSPPTPEYFAAKGFSVVACPWRKVPVALESLGRIRAMRAGTDRVLARRALGVVQTTWCGFAPFADALKQLGDGGAAGTNAASQSAACFTALTKAMRTPPPAETAGLQEFHVRGGLPNVRARLATGGVVRVAYLGGSITAAPGWRVLTLDWLRKKYPGIAWQEIHAAIGGTGAEFGACRFASEVLAKQPDLLFVEFAVNDGGTPSNRLVRAMEGIVRQAWRADPHTDICFVYTLGQNNLKTLQSGSYQSSAEIMEYVAGRYGIPSIHLGVEVARLEKDGKLVFTGPLPKTDDERKALGGRIVFAGDQVHPHVETGHPLYLAAIQRAWPALTRKARRVAHACGEPLDAANWEDARMIPIADIRREGGWVKLAADAPPVRNARPAQTPVWSAGHAGDALVFRFRGRSFGLYGLKGPDAGNFRVTVDDRAPVIGAQFDAYCSTGRWRTNPWFYPGELPDGEHSVRIELLGTAPDKDAILKARNERLDNPEQKAATSLHASHLLLVGELLE